MSQSPIEDSNPALDGKESGATPIAIVDALKSVAGNPPKVRASFAKGQCVRGRFEPTVDAATITRSASFTHASVVRGRFSMGGGNPNVADTNKLVLRGLALHVGEGAESSDLLVENAPVHFAKSLDQMLGFLRARFPGSNGQPSPEKVKEFSEANPETLNQAKYIAARSLPGSFAGTTYWGVHSFKAINVLGETRLIKFKVVPAAGEFFVENEEANALSADFLFQDLAERIGHGGVRFHVLAILGQPGDPTEDVTQRWPNEDDREAVKLGTIVIDALSDDEACDATFFNPSNLADGIIRPTDEIFAARAQAYADSLARRRR
ncbi:catalase [Paraburkholderia sp. CNPSo 3155]|uniref:catalase family peroxidase n=1 Tax=Paraburkholderia atlantica TaxID=2654982 RepID=UPI00128E6772|nr:catalase family peroxidase [Paraburkholderia atlantica]MPW06912.1 catalase [Paraburkholderia atlantica]